MIPAEPAVDIGNAGQLPPHPGTWRERPRWLLFCVWFVCDLLSWQTPGALSPHPEDLS